MPVVKFDIADAFTPDELREARARIEMFFALENGSLADDGKIHLGPPLLYKFQDASADLSRIEMIGTVRQQVVMDIARIYQMAASYFGGDDDEES